MLSDTELSARLAAFHAASRDSRPPLADPLRDHFDGEEPVVVRDADPTVSSATEADRLSRAGIGMKVAYKPNQFVPKRDLIKVRGLPERTVERFRA